MAQTKFTDHESDGKSLRSSTAKHLLLSRLRTEPLQHMKEERDTEKRGEGGLLREVAEIYITARCSCEIPLQSRGMQRWEDGKRAL